MRYLQIIALCALPVTVAHAQGSLVTEAPDNAEAQGFRIAWDEDGDGPSAPRFGHIGWGDSPVAVGPVRANCTVQAQRSMKRAVITCFHGSLGVGSYVRCDDGNITNDSMELLITTAASGPIGMLTVACDNTVEFPSDTLGRSDPQGRGNR